MTGSSALELSAWLLPENPNSLICFKEHASKLTRVYPLWYSLGDEGLASRRWSIHSESRQQLIEIAKTNSVGLWPSISNFNTGLGIWDSGRLARILGDKHCAASHLRQLLQLAKEDSAQGLSLNYQALGSSSGERFSEFVRMAAEACKKAGLKLAVAVHSKRSADRAEDDSDSQDYKALAKLADLLQLMTYEGEGVSDKAGPIAPPSWSKKVLEYASSMVEPGRLEFGFPVYGYSWKKTERTQLSILRKLLQARENRIGKAACWVLGSEDPRLWEMLEDFPVPFA
jgi:spore germination protein YaaH